MLRTPWLVVIVTGMGVFAQAASTSSDQELRLPPVSYGEAVRLWQGGAPQAALDALEAHTRAPLDLDALVLRARLLEAAGRDEDAEQVWRECLTREPWIRTFARRALVELLIRQRQPAEAATVLRALTESDAMRHRDLALAVADAFRDAELWADASRVYRQIVAQRSRGSLADAARLGLAAALEGAGDRRAALAQLRETRLRHASATVYQQARDHERALARDLDVTAKPLDESEYRLLTRRLRNASRFALALDLLDEWQQAHPLSARPDRIAAERIETLYAERSNDEAVEAAQRFYQEHSVSDLVPQVRLIEFRLAVRMTDTERAREMGRDLWDGRVPGADAFQRRSAAVLLAAYLAAVGELEQSLELYRELFRSSDDADDQRAYLWRAGVAALRAGQNERAMTNLRGLLGRNPSGDLAPATLYWLGATEQRSAPDRAVETFLKVHRRFPFHYYGIRARQRLEEAAPAVTGDTGLEFPRLALPAAVTARAEYRAAMTLARAGLVTDAAWYLRRLLDRQRTPALALLAARASAEAGDYAAVSRIMVSYFGGFLRQPGRGLPDDFWHLAYPRPFWDAVQAAADRSGVDPVLLVSLMRQESRFDSTARSPVGAVGLFQIMPYTASALGQAAGLGDMFADEVDEAMLMQPAVNAAIAARLTANLLRQFDGEIAPVIASYNAGEERVAVWWSASSGLGEDVFVDSIPYTETRRFVREVLTNYATYRRVYGESAAHSGGGGQ